MSSPLTIPDAARKGPGYRYRTGDTRLLAWLWILIWALFCAGIAANLWPQPDASVRMQREVDAILAGVVLFLLPLGILVALYAAFTSLRKSRHWSITTVWSVVVGIFLAAGFMFFWIAADNERSDFTDSQWRLLGWAALATAAAIRWRRFLR